MTAASSTVTSFAALSPTTVASSVARNGASRGVSVSAPPTRGAVRPGVFWDGGCERPLSRARWVERLRGDHQGIPDVRRHIEVQAHDDEDGLRMLAVGMGRFGLFDLEISGLDREDADEAAIVLCLAAHLLTERDALAEAGYLSLDIDAVRNPAARRGLVKPSGAARRATRVALD